MILSEKKKSTLVIIDESREPFSQNLYQIVSREDSQLKIITIGNMDIALNQEGCLVICLTESDENLLAQIIRQRNPDLSSEVINLVTYISGGYPRIAVMATDNINKGIPLLKSADDVIERILTSCNITDKKQVKALEYLALFSELGVDENESQELDYVAEKLARFNSEEMYEYLAYAAQNIVVRRSGNFFSVQPLPVAIFLGKRRLELLRVNTIINFIENAPSNLRRKFLSRWQYFDDLPIAYRISQKVLSWNSSYHSVEKLNEEIGLDYLNAFIHIDPDLVAYFLESVYGNLSLDELDEAIQYPYKITPILAKLASRKSTFYKATKLWLKLTAIKESSSNNYNTNTVFQLFQSFHSGTEVEPSVRLDLLREISKVDDLRIIKICVLALETTIKRDYTGIIYSGLQIGTSPPIQSWHPKIWGDVFDFQCQVLQELSLIYKQCPSESPLVKKVVGNNLRGLIRDSLLQDIVEISRLFNRDTEPWFEGIRGLNHWLYFDRNKYTEDLQKNIRELYDELLPKDLLGQAILYTIDWSSNLYDPCLTDQMDDRNYDYSSDEARKVAVEISTDEEKTWETIEVMMTKELNNSLPFTRELGKQFFNSDDLFVYALKLLEKNQTRSSSVNFFQGLFEGILEKYPECFDQYRKLINDSSVNTTIKNHLNLFVKCEKSQISIIIDRLQTKQISATDCIPLSYGQRLNGFTPKEIEPLLDELIDNHSAEGLWSSLEIIGMYSLNQSEIDEILIEKIKTITTSSELLFDRPQIIHSTHFFTDLIEKISASIFFNNEYINDLMNQIILVCRAEDFIPVDLDLRKDLMKLLILLIPKSPSLVWNSLSSFYTNGTIAERRKLLYLLNVYNYSHSDDLHKQAGLLFKLPQEPCIQWAEQNPQEFSGFLCSFYPIFTSPEENQKIWHPSLVNLTEKFGQYSQFREALSDRFYPTTWSGLLISYLEIYLNPLEEWSKNHPVVEMRNWSNEMLNSLKRQIEQERIREQY